jgi:hypothetical protein
METKRLLTAHVNSGKMITRNETKGNKMKFAKEITLYNKNNKTSYDITIKNISIGITEIKEYRTEQRAERIDFTAQTDGDKTFYYALKTDTSISLNGSMDDKSEIVMELVKQYKKWYDKNETLVSSVQCQYKLFKLFLESKFKVKEFYNWEVFCDNTFK